MSLAAIVCVSAMMFSSANADVAEPYTEPVEPIGATVMAPHSTSPPQGQQATPSDAKKVAIKYGDEMTTYEEPVDPTEYEKLYAMETLENKRFRIYKKNTKVGFVWMPMKDAISYQYKIVNAKTGKTVKHVNTRSLQGFLPASLNKTKATYRLHVYGVDKNGKTSANRQWADYFHTEAVVIKPKLLRWCGITFKEDRNLLGTVINGKFEKYVEPTRYEDPDTGGSYIDE